MASKTPTQEVGRRKFGRRVEMALMSLGAAASLLYLYTAWWGPLPTLKQRAVILLVCSVFAFLYYPMRKRSPWGWTFVVDCGLAFLSTVILIYIMAIERRIAFSMSIGSPPDLAVGIIFILLVLEATRRLVGWILVILPIVLLAYAVFGPYLPGVLHHAGVDWRFMITVAAFHTQGGVFGIPLEVASTVIIIFIIFSSFLRQSGAQIFFVDLPYALFGWMRGGPAKIAVVGSSLLGTITGSPVANVVGVGTFTIPLMKRTGYSSEMAGAIEAMSSTGASFMPPVMGAVAFVMAEFLNISYWAVCLAAFVPAALYYISLFAVVDLEAGKTGLKGLPRSQLPSVKKALAKGWFLLIPLILLIYLMAMRWSPMKAGFVAIVATVLVSYLSKGTRMGPRKLFDALAGSMKEAVLVTIACAAAGIVISIINMTGIGVRISSLLIEISGGQVIVLLILTAIVNIILGMGLTAVAIYIFLALLLGPALTQMGVLPIAAHLFILYYGCLSSITPPVAIATYAAAAMANSDMMKTGFLACRLALVGFIVPFFFVFQPALILQGDTGTIVVSVLTAVIGVVSLAIMQVGFLLTKTGAFERSLFGVSGFLILFPNVLTQVVGLALLVPTTTLHVLRDRRRKPAIAS